MPMCHKSLKVRIGYVFDGTDFRTKIGRKLIIVGHLDYQNYAHLVLTQRNPVSRFFHLNICRCDTIEISMKCVPCDGNTIVSKVMKNQTSQQNQNSIFEYFSFMSLFDITTLIVRKRSCGKVMFSQACVKNSVYRGVGVHTPPRQAPPWADTPSPEQTPPPMGRHSLFLLLQIVSLITQPVIVPEMVLSFYYKVVYTSWGSGSTK